MLWVCCWAVASVLWNWLLRRDWIQSEAAKGKKKKWGLHKGLKSRKSPCGFDWGGRFDTTVNREEVGWIAEGVEADSM